MLACNRPYTRNLMATANKCKYTLSYKQIYFFGNFSNHETVKHIGELICVCMQDDKQVEQNIEILMMCCCFKLTYVTYKDQWFQKCIMMLLRSAKDALNRL